MCRRIIILFTILFTHSSFSQISPQITFDQDGDQAKLGIQSIKINVEIVGMVALTTYDVVFYNDLNRILEGELNFPLQEGQTISRFDLSVNGKLREGVVVPKDKGRKVFEEIIRGRIDPELIERTKGNNFKARIYPIPAKGTKRLVLAYEQALPLYHSYFQYDLDLSLGQEVQQLELNIIVKNNKSQPVLFSKYFKESFSTNKEGYRYSFKAENINFDDRIKVEIPIQNKDHLYFYR